MAGPVKLNPPWGLDRIDQRYLPLDGSFDAAPNRLGVRVYVLDTGIRTSHAQFDTISGSRASVGYDAIGDG